MLTKWAGNPFVKLTTIGRRTGWPHRIEISFAVEDGPVRVELIPAAATPAAASSRSA